jgi:hypothetical protein
MTEMETGTWETSMDIETRYMYIYIRPLQRLF